MDTWLRMQYEQNRWGNSVWRCPGGKICNYTTATLRLSGQTFQANEKCHSFRDIEISYVGSVAGGLQKRTDGWNWLLPRRVRAILKLITSTSALATDPNVGILTDRPHLRIISFHDAVRRALRSLWKPFTQTPHRAWLRGWKQTMENLVSKSFRPFGKQSSNMFIN